MKFKGILFAGFIVALGCAGAWQATQWIGAVNIDREELKVVVAQVVNNQQVLVQAWNSQFGPPPSEDNASPEDNVSPVE